MPSQVGQERAGRQAGFGGRALGEGCPRRPP